MKPLSIGIANTLFDKQNLSFQNSLHGALLALVALLVWLAPLSIPSEGRAQAAEFADLVEATKASVVGIGTVQNTRRPPRILRGTGFVVGDGRLVITNAHVLPDSLNSKEYEYLAVFAGSGPDAQVRTAQVLLEDQAHDLALLRFDGPELPALSLSSQQVREGQEFAFTGFPIGMVLGLYPVTHRAMVSSISPIVLPATQARQLDAKLIRQLRDPYPIFQLDATAYPGNSGSPLYDTETGAVVAVLNMVFVKERKENVLSKPSGIAYAIPIKWAKKLLDSHGADSAEAGR